MVRSLRLGDIAKVSYGTKDRETYTRVNGKEAIGVIIEKTKDGNIVEIANTAKKQLEEMKPLFPQGASYDIITDNSEMVKDAISNVTSSGLQALVIAAIVLLVFLKDIRASIFISLSIPISANVHIIPFKYSGNITEHGFTYGISSCSRITGG